MKQLLIIILSFMVFSCQTEYEKKLDKMKKAHVEYLEEQAFKNNFEINILEYIPIEYKTKDENFLDTMRINENNEKMRLLVEKTKQQFEKVKEAARECELYAKVAGKDDILSKMSIDKLEKEQKEIESYKDSMLFYKERDSLLWLRIDNRKYSRPVYLYKAYVKAVLKYNDGRTQNLADTLHPVMNSECKVYDWRNK